MMRILFDQGVPRGLGVSLNDHTVTEARHLKWDKISNGELLRMAEAAGFDLMVTTDKNVRYQQNLSGRKISIVVLAIVAAVNGATPGSFAEVEIPFQ